MPDLPLVAQLTDRADLVGERDLRIGLMQLPEVDRVQPKAAEAGLAVGPQALWAPVGLAVAAEPALGGDHEPFGIRVSASAISSSDRP